MGTTKKRGRRQHKNKRVLQHRLSIMGISCVIMMLIAVLLAGSVSLHKKNEKYKIQEARLEAQIAEEEARAQELAELEVRIDTDEYVIEIAKDKLGLVFPDELYFESE